MLLPIYNTVIPTTFIPFLGIESSKIERHPTPKKTGDQRQKYIRHIHPSINISSIPSFRANCNSQQTIDIFDKNLKIHREKKPCAPPFTARYC